MQPMLHCSMVTTKPSIVALWSGMKLEENANAVCDRHILLWGVVHVHLDPESPRSGLSLTVNGSSLRRVLPIATHGTKGAWRTTLGSAGLTQSSQS